MMLVGSKGCFFRRHYLRALMWCPPQTYSLGLFSVIWFLCYAEDPLSQWFLDLMKLKSGIAVGGRGNGAI